MRGLGKSVVRWAMACALTAGVSATAPAQPAPPAPRPPAAPVPKPPATGSAQEATPSMTTATYGDWVVRCTQQAEHHACEVAQSIYLQGQPNPVAVIAVGREKPSEPLRLVVQLPVNVTFAGRLKITLKEGAPTIDLNIERCVPAGCFAVMQPADEALRRLRTQTDPGRISYKDASQRDVEWPFSLRGLSSALDALQKG